MTVAFRIHFIKHSINKMGPTDKVGQCYKMGEQVDQSISRGHTPTSLQLLLFSTEMTHNDMYITCTHTYTPAMMT